MQKFADVVDFHCLRIANIQGRLTSRSASTATWPWFVLMDDILGQRHSTVPPVLIASIPED